MNTVATTMMHTRVPKALRDDVKETANSLGISMSLIVEQALRNFAATKELFIHKPLVPTPYLEGVLREVDKDIRERNTDAFSPAFSTAEEANKYLDNL